MLLTIASLACLVLVFLGNREPKNNTTLGLYFWRVRSPQFALREK